MFLLAPHELPCNYEYLLEPHSNSSLDGDILKEGSTLMEMYTQRGKHIIFHVDPKIFLCKKQHRNSFCNCTVNWLSHSVLVLYSFLKVDYLFSRILTETEIVSNPGKKLTQVLGI